MPDHLRLFDVAGKYVRTVGREGEGPGEYRFIIDLLITHDTLYVVDANRVTRVWQDTLVDTRLFVRSAEGNVSPRGLAGSGFFFTEERGLKRQGEIYQDTIDVFFLPRQDLSGAEAPRTVSSLPWRPWVCGPTNCSNLGDFHPLSGELTFDDQGFVYVHYGENYKIDVFDTLGARVRSITRDHQPETFPRERRLAHAQSTAGTRLTDLPPSMRMYPALGPMYVSAAGTVMVCRPDIAIQSQEEVEHPAACDIFDPVGEYLGTLTLPEDFRPRSIGDRFVLGVTRDALGVEYVTRHVWDLPP
jgi:hypothetical protein